MDPVWASKVVGCRDGSQFYDYDDLNAVTMFMGTFKVGTELEHIIRKKTKKSSDAQRRYYWAVIIKLLNEDQGYLPNNKSLHYHLAYELLGGYVNEKGIRVIPSTEDLSTVEREEYHENCRRWAAIVVEVNIPLPSKVEA